MPRSQMEKKRSRLYYSIRATEEEKDRGKHEDDNGQMEVFLRGPMLHRELKELKITLSWFNDWPKQARICEPSHSRNPPYIFQPHQILFNTICGILEGVHKHKEYYDQITIGRFTQISCIISTNSRISSEENCQRSFE